MRISEMFVAEVPFKGKSSALLPLFTNWNVLVDGQVHPTQFTHFRVQCGNDDDRFHVGRVATSLTCTVGVMGRRTPAAPSYIETL